MEINYADADVTNANAAGNARARNAADAAAVRNANGSAAGRKHAEHGCWHASLPMLRATNGPIFGRLANTR